jgi:hypothetical protein
LGGHVRLEFSYAALISECNYRLPVPERVL